MKADELKDFLKCATKEKPIGELTLAAVKCFAKGREGRRVSNSGKLALNSSYAK